MLVFGSEMHVVTFVFVLLELIMFGFQLVYYLSRPDDKHRMWYLILLVLLIIYNVTGGIFPDPKLNIPVSVQNIIAYGSGFLTASYFPYYFYKSFDLKSLRFHALYGVPLFLLLPYTIFFVIGYSINHDLGYATSVGMIAPFFYSLVLLWAIFKAIRKAYKADRARNLHMEEIAVYWAVLPWGTMTVFSYFQVSQLIEVLCTNTGFIIITLVFISRSVRRARGEYELLKELPEARQLIFEDNCKRFILTAREIEIVKLIRQGHRYKSIAKALFISERTVDKHVEHIYEKVNVSGKIELIYKLENLPL